MSAWRYVRKDSGTNWNSIAIQRNLIRDDCYLTQTLMKWLEESIGLGEYSKKKAKKDFETSLNIFLHRLDKDSLKFLKDMYEYNIKHVVKEDRFTTLPTYCLLSIIRKIFSIGLSHD